VSSLDHCCTRHAPHAAFRAAISDSSSASSTHRTRKTKPKFPLLPSLVLQPSPPAQCMNAPLGMRCFRLTK
ncbi:MAG: hypothetical protein ACK55Z_28880, partial [bacterium]